MFGFILRPFARIDFVFKMLYMVEARLEILEKELEEKGVLKKGYCSVIKETMEENK